MQSPEPTIRLEKVLETDVQLIQELRANLLEYLMEFCKSWNARHPTREIAPEAAWHQAKSGMRDLLTDCGGMFGMARMPREALKERFFEHLTLRIHELTLEEFEDKERPSEDLSSIMRMPVGTMTDKENGWPLEYEND